MLQCTESLINIQEPTMLRQQPQLTRLAIPRQISFPCRLRPTKTQIQITILWLTSFRFLIPLQRNFKHLWRYGWQWRPRMSAYAFSERMTLSSEDYDVQSSRYASCCLGSYVEDSSVPPTRDISCGYLSKGSNFRFFKARLTNFKNTFILWCSGKSFLCK